jgi:hypothetical protein
MPKCIHFYQNWPCWLNKPVVASTYKLFLTKNIFIYLDIRELLPGIRLYYSLKISIIEMVKTQQVFFRA